MGNFLLGSQIPACDTKYDLAWGDDRGTVNQNLLRTGNMPPVTPDNKMHMGFSHGSGGQGYKSRLHNWYEHGGLKDLLNSPMYMPGIIKESPRHHHPMGIGRDLHSTEYRAGANFPAGQSGNVQITLNYNDFRPTSHQMAQFTPQNLFFGQNPATHCSKCLSAQCVCNDTLRMDSQAMKEKF